MLSNLRKKTEGFTIIEVLIVLAIAGLIMLIVFLAVPALQRNSRNSQRNNDAARLAAAVNECLANRNNDTASCDTDADLEQGSMSQLTTLAISTTGTAPSSSTSGAGVWYNRECTTNGSSSQASSTGPRSFVVLFSLEPSVTRCVSS